MPAVLLETPPNDGHLWIPPGALGPNFKIVYTLGRNNGAYLGRGVRSIIAGEISHTMGGSGTETVQSFANSEMGESATLAEQATFPKQASPWGVATLLQSLPLDLIGAGSVAGCATGITHESAEISGDPNLQYWTPDHLALKIALTSWLIRNPLLAAGDRKWAKLQIKFQLYKNPYAPTSDTGGLGCHTMWDTCGIAAGGTNPWTLYCKSCPGWARRGATRKVLFPTGSIQDIPLVAGNFRDYFEGVGQALAAGPITPPPPLVVTPPKDPDMPLIVKGDAAVAGVVPGPNCPEWAKPYFNDPGAQWEVKDGCLIRNDSGNYSNITGIETKKQADINALLNMGRVRSTMQYAVAPVVDLSKLATKDELEQAAGDLVAAIQAATGALPQTARIEGDVRFIRTS